MKGHDFSKLHIFAGVSDFLRIITVLATSKFLNLSDGEVLLEAGTENHFLYFLLAGKLVVRLTMDANEPAKYICPGESVGDMSIIDGNKTSAHVYSEGNSELFAVHEDDFWQHLAPHPAIMRNFTRLIVQRLRSNGEQLVRNLEQQLKFEQMKKELAAARVIQMGSLPHQFPLLPDHNQFDVHAHLLPAKEVGGDLFDTFAINDGHIMVAVGDVAGKGMPAALFMMRTLALLRAQVRSKETPEQLFPKLNRLLCEHNDSDMFVTLNVAIVSAYDGNVLVLNGGHPSPLLSRQEGAFQAVSGAKGALMGISPEATYQGVRLVMEPGDRMIFYSDGVIEAENSAGEFFTVERAYASLDCYPCGGSMKGLVDTLFEAVKTFSGDAEQSDDITILALRYLGGGENTANAVGMEYSDKAIKCSPQRIT
jgi:sigma-B regulation protein RsbU (phosphoserine phosphatase)